MYYVCYFILETTGNFMWISLRVRADPVVLKLSYELYYFAGALVTVVETNSDCLLNEEIPLVTTSQTLELLTKLSSRFFYKTYLDENWPYSLSDVRMF